MTARDETTGALRVLSLNLGGDGDKYGAWDARVARTAEAIRADDADIVMLQAAIAFDNDTGPLPALLAALPEYTYQAFTPAKRYGEGWLGSAVLSRRPLTVSRTLPLTCIGGEDDNNRVLLHVAVDFDGRTLNLIDAHFSWVGEQAAANLSETLRYASGIAGEMLLVGDLNQTPDSDFARAFAAAGWTDGWMARRGQDDGFTFETGKLWGRIDHLWLRGDLVDALAEIDVVPAAPDQALSDHLALRFTLQGPTI